MTREPKVCVSFEATSEFEGRILRMADAKGCCKSVLIRQVLLEALTSFEASLSVNDRYENSAETNKTLINSVDDQARFIAMALNFYKQSGMLK